METRNQPTQPSFMERVARGLHQLRSGGIDTLVDFSEPSLDEATNDQAASVALPADAQPASEERLHKRPDNGWSGSWD